MDLKLRSSIKPSYMRFVLIRGTILAALGAIILLYGALYLPVSNLSVYGLPLLCIAGIFITIGLRPYRRLCKLEKQPHELIATGEQGLNIAFNGKATMYIPLNSIKTIDYIEIGRQYGIGIDLEKPVPEKIIVKDGDFDIDRFEERSQENYQSDIFIPFFSERSFRQLTEFLESTPEETS